MKVTYLAIAAAVLSGVSARPMPQIGGDATACYGVVNNVDNGSGYAVENVEDNAADLITGQPTGSDSEGGSGGSGPTRRLTRRDLHMLARQLNKISDGFATLGDALGVSAVSNPVAAIGNNVDTVGTNDQGDIGTEIGQDEDTYIPGLANTATDLDPNGGLPALDSVGGTATGAAGGAGGAAPPAPPARRRL